VCGAEFRAVKTAAQFDDVDAFILPGGESTTMLKLIDNFGLWDALARNFKTKPVWGICAGCILIASRVESPAQKSFGLLPMTVQRNGYGRQIDSHHGDIEGYPVSFIRAPVITAVEKVAEVLAKVDDHPVWVRHGKVMVTTFHPELTLDFPSPMHKTFVDMI
jgi:pyridoxal 5'-phosphate synthase pdxT subunit